MYIMFGERQYQLYMLIQIYSEVFLGHKNWGSTVGNFVKSLLAFYFGKEQCPFLCLFVIVFQANYLIKFRHTEQRLLSSFSHKFVIKVDLLKRKTKSSDVSDSLKS